MSLMYVESGQGQLVLSGAANFDAAFGAGPLSATMQE
jgi:hypothetical protein